MRKSQAGLGWFGTLLVLALAGGAGYYLYQQMVVGEDRSCAAEQNACLAKCRQTSTDNASIQACQERCRREADVCASLGR